jgi:hypothetical protein
VYSFICGHSRVTREKLREMMLPPGNGQRHRTILVGEDAVRCGLIDAMGTPATRWINSRKW